MTEATCLVDTLDVNTGATAQDYYFEVLADGFDPGSPEAVVSTLASFRLDGDEEVIGRHGNRTRQMLVRVTGVNQDALNLAEQALDLVVSNASSVTFAMPGAFVDTVFDVFWASITQSFDDLREVLSTQRVYNLSFRCHPFPHGPDRTTITLTAEAGTVTSLDAGTATTNWAAVAGAPAPAVLSHRGDSAVAFQTGLAFNDLPPSGPDPIAYDWTGTVGAGSTYLVLDYALQPGAGLSPRLGATYETAAIPLSTAAAPVAGYARHTYVNPGGTPRFWFASGVGGSGSGVATPVSYFAGALGKASTPPAALFLVPVPGSRRTECSLRAYRSSGLGLGSSGVPFYADPTMLSHGWQPNRSDTWEYAPAGSYLAFIPTTGAAAGDSVTLTYTTPSGFGSVVQSQTTIQTLAATVPTLGVPVGVFDLGETRDGLAGAGTWAATRTPSTAITLTDNLVLIRLADDAALAILPTTGGSTTTELFVEEPSAALPQGGLFATISAVTRDVSDKAGHWDQLVMTPPLTPLWSPSSGAFSSQSTTYTIDVSLWARYLNHVAP